MTQMFTEKTFLAGHVIAQEGEPLTEAYIIQQGQCKLISTGIPRLFNEEDDEDDEIRETRTILANNKGYFSQTTNQF